MTARTLILAPGEAADLTGAALEAALRLASAGADVDLLDLRDEVGAEPFDARDVPPARWLTNGSATASWVSRIPPAGGWLVAGPVGRRTAGLPGSIERLDASGWFEAPPPFEGTGRPGGLRLEGLRWPARVRLGGLLRCTCESPLCDGADALPLEIVDPLLQAMERAGCELLLDACSFFDQRGIDLARWLLRVAPGLVWRLLVGPRLDAEQAHELRATGCAGIVLCTPTPAAAVFAAQAPRDDPRRLVAAVRAVGATLPVELIYEVGAPQETQATEREGALALREMAGAVAGLRLRPLAPRRRARFESGAGAAVEWTGPGPHGWAAGHVNHAWREKLCRELQLAAQSVGLEPAGKLSLPREFVRHREEIVARLTDPLHGAPPALRDKLPLAGVLHGERALCGPRMLEIDLTNDCNNTCVGCWCHSLMMGADRFSGAYKKRYLPAELIFRLLDDAAATGTRAVQLAGSGEPFMHPQIIELLEHAKRLGLELTVITNVNFITREWADRLIAAGVDRITASVWAGSPEMYVRTHPNQTEKSFERIRDVLAYLWREKRRQGRELPLIKMYHVISSINCREIAPMVEFAVETGCEQVEFQMVDVVPGKSDVLALSPLDRAAVIEQFKELSLRAVDPTRTAAKSTALYDALDSGAEVRQFGKFAKPLFEEFAWGDPLLETLRCPAGREGSLPVDRFCDATETRYHYYWSVWDCHRCPRYEECPVDKTHLRLTREFTELVGFGSFYRRLVSQKQAPGGGVRYETALVDRVPCTVGWTYSRVRVSGEVIPCCKGHDHPLGSLHEQSFREIWFGPATDEFRRHAVREKKSHPFFGRIDCYKACDNVGMNLATQAEIEALTDQERAALRSATEASFQ